MDELAQRLAALTERKERIKEKIIHTVRGIYSFDRLLELHKNDKYNQRSLKKLYNSRLLYMIQLKKLIKKL